MLLRDRQDEAIPVIQRLLAGGEALHLRVRLVLAV